MQSTQAATANTRVKLRLVNLRLVVEQTLLFLKTHVEQYTSAKSDAFKNPDLKQQLNQLFQDLIKDINEGELHSYINNEHLLNTLDAIISRKLDAIIDFNEQVEINPHFQGFEKTLAKEMLIALAKSFERWQHINISKIDDIDAIWKSYRPYVEQQIREDNAEAKQAIDQLLSEIKALIINKFKRSNFTVTNSEDKHPTCFISYAWPLLLADKFDESWTQKFTAKLASDLRLAGINVIMDLTHSQLGHDSVAFMHNYVNNSDFILVIGTQSLHSKFIDENRFGASVRNELNLIIAKQTKNRQEQKGDRVLPILLSGTLETSFPADFKRFIVTDSFQEEGTGYLSVIKNICHAIYKINNIGVSDQTFAEDHLPQLNANFAKVWTLLECNSNYRLLFKGFPKEAIKEYYLRKTEASSAEKKADLDKSMACVSALLSRQQQSALPVNYTMASPGSSSLLPPPSGSSTIVTNAKAQQLNVVGVTTHTVVSHSQADSMHIAGIDPSANKETVDAGKNFFP